MTTKEKPADRVDNPFLVEKLRSEVEGIFLWALEGLHHLIANHYQFTVSERTANNLKEAMEQGNNVTSFLKSEVYFSVLAGSRCKSTDFPRRMCDSVRIIWRSHWQLQPLFIR